MGLTIWAEKGILNHVCASTVGYSPTTGNCYLALCTGDPGDDVSGTIANECTEAGKGYARTQITFNAAAARAIVQSAAVTFPEVTGSNYSAALTHWAVMDAQTAGKMLATGSFAAGFTPVVGNRPTVATGAVSITVAAGSGASLTNTCVHKALDMLFRNGAAPWTKPATWVRLCTATLSDTSTTFAELSGNNYPATGVRVFPNGAGGGSPEWTTVDTTAPTKVRNLLDVAFPSPSGTWPQFVAQCITSSSGASGATDVLFYGNDVVDQGANANDPVLFPANQLSISIS